MWASASTFPSVPLLQPPQLEQPFLLLATPADSVVDCRMSADRHQVELQVSGRGVRLLDDRDVLRELGMYRIRRRHLRQLLGPELWPLYPGELVIEDDAPLQPGEIPGDDRLGHEGGPADQQHQPAGHQSPVTRSTAATPAIFGGLMDPLAVQAALQQQRRRGQQNNINQAQRTSTHRTGF